MSRLSRYKRKCDIYVGGCGRIVDVTRCLSIVRGRYHLCLGCGAKQLREVYRTIQPVRK